MGRWVVHYDCRLRRWVRVDNRGLLLLRINRDCCGLIYDTSACIAAGATSYQAIRIGWGDASVVGRTTPIYLVMNGGSDEATYQLGEPTFEQLSDADDGQ